MAASNFSGDEVLSRKTGHEKAKAKKIEIERDLDRSAVKTTLALVETRREDCRAALPCHDQTHELRNGTS